uniref:Uncharacterized protein n=1 Tax=Romanomermis culicivorax TaxID=13658 RepID=A0A915L7C6_ROMCU
MVHNLVFPSTLTEEELHLKKMFELLRKIVSVNLNGTFEKTSSRYRFTQKNAKNCENEHGNVGTTMVIPSSNSSTSKMKPKKEARLSILKLMLKR